MGTQIKTVAAIDVGSNALRMIIAEIKDQYNVVILDELRKSINLGRDTFAYGRVSVETVHQICDVLKGFARLMKEYRVDNYRAVATSGIREAENGEYIIERIRLVTGLNVEIINNSQERFFTYKAIQDYLPDMNEIRKKGVLIVDIGSGGVEISVYGLGHLQFTDYIKVGSLRLSKILAEVERITQDFPRIMEEFIESKIYLLEPYIRDMDIENFIGLGGEIKTILTLCKGFGKQPKEKFIYKQSLTALYSEVRTMTKKQIIEEYGLSHDDAGVLLPSVIIFYKFLNMTRSNGVYAPLASLRHGIIADMVDAFFHTQRKRDFVRDILSSVRYIGRRYAYDETHARHVEELAVSIYDQTRYIHGLGQRERFDLQIAANMHDIGKYINLNQHDVHSYDIIRSLDIMGLSHQELNLIANTVRYHSEENPSQYHDNYRGLDLQDRIKVSKLAAILKLSDALDISHRQKVKNFEIITLEKQLLFKIHTSEDILLEEWTFKNRADLFEEVMGKRPVIKRIVW